MTLWTPNGTTTEAYVFLTLGGTAEAVPFPNRS